MVPCHYYDFIVIFITIFIILKWFLESLILSINPQPRKELSINFD